MANKSFKIGIFILFLIILIVGFFGYQKIFDNKKTIEKTETEILGNSQKSTDKYNQLLIKVAGTGEEGDGDIITIGGENHEWGNMEKIKFLIVTIPVLSKEDQSEFTKVEDGKRVYRVAYEKFLTLEEIKNFKTQTEAFEKYILISKEDVVKR